jgi:hypothetical protein
MKLAVLLSDEEEEEVEDAGGVGLCDGGVLCAGGVF